MKRILPFQDRVVVRLIPEENQGTLIIPDAGRQKTVRGEIIAVGPGRHEFGDFVQVQAKVGQIVHLPQVGFMEIDFEGETYRIGPDRELLGYEESYNTLADRDQ